MSEALILTGKRGQGKTLYAVDRIRRYMRAGRMVATNLDIFPEKLLPAFNRVCHYRLPDHPGIDDLKAMPLGNVNPRNEGMNGLLVLDEAATFLNSREWNENKKERVKFIGWLAQSRKFGWDLIVIVQHVNMLDSQIRESLFEHVGVCVNLQGVIIPGLTRLSGGWVKFPKIHRCAVRLGAHARAPLVEHVFFRGEDLYHGYDTLQVINPVVGIPEGCGHYRLSAWHLRGRYMSWWATMKRVLFAAAVLGFVLGISVSEAWRFFKPVPFPENLSAVSAPVLAQDTRVFDESVKVFGFYKIGGVTHLLVPGKDIVPVGYKAYSDGRVEYEVTSGVWIKGGK
jgi:hypothetical protein